MPDELPNHRLTLYFAPEFGDPIWAGLDYELTAPRQERGEWVLGRSPTAQITLNLRTISAKHAVISYSYANDSWLLSDMESENGTYLNGKKVEPPRRPQAIQIGDRIDLGPKARIQVVENAQDTVPDELELGPPTIASTTPIDVTPAPPPAPPAPPPRTFADTAYYAAQWFFSGSTVLGKVYRVLLLAAGTAFVVALIDLAQR